MFKIVRTNPGERVPNLQNLFLAVGIVGALAFLATILTYQDFFFFNPFEVQSKVRSAFLVLTTLGWVVALFGPLTVLSLISGGRAKALHALPWVALAWPATLIVNHLALLIETHKLYVGYLFVYPLFLVTDVALPIVYLLIWRYLKHHSA